MRKQFTKAHLGEPGIQSLPSIFAYEHSLTLRQVYPQDCNLVRRILKSKIRFLRPTSLSNVHLDGLILQNHWVKLHDKTVHLIL